MRKRFIFLLIAGSALTLITSLWTSPVSAASLYDDTLRTTNGVYIRDNNSAPMQDITTNYMRWTQATVAQSNPSNPSPDAFAFFGRPVPSNFPQWLDDISDLYNQSMDTGARAITTLECSSGNECTNDRRITVLYFTTDVDSYDIQFLGTTPENSNISIKPTSNCSATLYELRISPNRTTERYYNLIENTCGNVSSSSKYISTYTQFAQTTLFLSTFNVIYPSGYEGQPIPDQLYFPTAFHPDFQWSVSSDGTLRASYMDNATVSLNGTGNYFLVESDDEWQPGQELNQQLLQPFFSKKYVYEFLPGEGYYSLRITYEESPPGSIVAPPGYDFVGTVYLRIYWDGESTIVGDTTGCEIDGQFLECSNVDNNQNKFWSVLTSVDASFFGLDAVVTAPLAFIMSLLSYTTVCSPLTLPVPYVSENITIPCMTETVYQPHFAPLLEFYQSVLTALVVYYVFVRLLSVVKDVQDPHINRIEVAKL